MGGGGSWRPSLHPPSTPLQLYPSIHNNPGNILLSLLSTLYTSPTTDSLLSPVFIFGMEGWVWWGVGRRKPRRCRGGQLKLDGTREAFKEATIEEGRKCRLFSLLLKACSLLRPLWVRWGIFQQVFLGAGGADQMMSSWSSCWSRRWGRWAREASGQGLSNIH